MIFLAGVGSETLDFDQDWDPGLFFFLLFKKKKPFKCI